MAAEKPNRAEVAMALEDEAAATLQKLVEELAPFSCDADVIAVAQAQATLALGQRVADLTDRLAGAPEPAPAAEPYRQALCEIASGGTNAVALAQRVLAENPV